MCVCVPARACERVCTLVRARVCMCAHEHVCARGCGCGCAHVCAFQRCVVSAPMPVTACESLVGDDRKMALLQNSYCAARASCGPRLSLLFHWPLCSCSTYHKFNFSLRWFCDVLNYTILEVGEEGGCVMWTQSCTFRDSTQILLPRALCEVKLGIFIFSSSKYRKGHLVQRML